MFFKIFAKKPWTSTDNGTFCTIWFYQMYFNIYGTHISFQSPQLFTITSKYSGCSCQAIFLELLPLNGHWFYTMGNGAWLLTRENCRYSTLVQNGSGNLCIKSCRWIPVWYWQYGPNDHDWNLIPCTWGQHFRVSCECQVLHISYICYWCDICHSILQWNFHKFISFSPGRCDCNHDSVIFKLISKIAIMQIAGVTALRWTPQGLTDD